MLVRSRRRAGRYGGAAWGRFATGIPAWRNPSLNDFELSWSTDFTGLADDAALETELQAKFPTFYRAGSGTVLDTGTLLNGHPTAAITNQVGSSRYAERTTVETYTRVWMRTAILVPSGAASLGLGFVGGVSNSPAYDPYHTPEYVTASDYWSLFGAEVAFQPQDEIEGVWVYPVWRFDSDGTAVLFINGLPAGTVGGMTAAALNNFFFNPDVGAGGSFHVGLLAWAIGDNPYSLPDPATYQPAMALSPAEYLVAQSGTIQFAATADGLPVAADEMEWSATGGTIDEDGLFTAGASDGIFEVTVEHPSGATATAVVEVGDFDAKTASPAPQAWNEVDLLALSADDPIETLSDDVNSNDMSQATAGARPLFKDNVLNGKAVAESDGSDDYLHTVAGDPPWGVGTTFLVLRRLGAISSGVRQCLYATSAGAVRLLSSDGGVREGWHLTITDNVVASAFEQYLGGDSTDWALITIRKVDADTLTVWFNDQQFNLSPTDVVDWFGGTSLGASVDSLFRHSTIDEGRGQCPIRAHWDESLSDAEVAERRRFFNAYYGGLY